MIYRIDIQHFISHAIDYFTNEELGNIKYLLMSLKLNNGGAVQTQVWKWVDVLPTNDVIKYDWESERDKYYKAYINMLHNRIKRDDEISITATIHNNIIKPLLDHEDRIIVCDNSENYIIDIFCDFLKEKYNINVINLNKLFSEGEHEPVEYDRNKLKKLGRRILKETEHDSIKNLELSEKGRRYLLENMSIIDKERKLKELGINYKKYNRNKYNELLEDIWVNDD